MGVEEEFFTVDPLTGALRDDGEPALRRVRDTRRHDTGTRYSEELRTCAVEGKTRICHDLAEVRAEVRDLREVLSSAGREQGIEIAAVGTYPLADWRTLSFSLKPRYEQVAERYARLAHEHVICACHVHVGVDGRDAAIAVVNRVRPWLPVLLALSSSSPFWMGDDTGYASYRA
ncbi:MAG: carboxylate-amine ligase, partial [Actinobacteria bacterium]|nr:carboxylate-amine ligase [Actinomycetota bacterium]